MADYLKNAASGAQESLSSGAQSATNAASSARDTVTSSTTEGEQKWDAMSNEQKKEAFDRLPEDQKRGKQSYYEWVMEGYHHQKENWLPWIEDQYLKWFTKDNKTSYATKSSLDKTKVTGIEQVDNLQDGVNSLASQQVGQGGLLQPVGDALSKEGINRTERHGKDESGGYGYGTSIANGASSVGSGVWGGAKSAGGYVSGLVGGGGKGEGEEKK